MEELIPNNPLLDLLECPAFLVKDDMIVQVNHNGTHRNIHPGQSISAYLGEMADTYRNFHDGCLYMKLALPGGATGATVSILEDMQLFRLDRSDFETENEQELSLPQIALHLRRPIHALYCELERKRHEEGIIRNLYQLHRIVTNMSDVPCFQERKNLMAECTDLFWFFSEIMDKAAALLKESGLKLAYTALPHCVHAMVDREMVERAVFNLISNAAKFSPENGVIQVKLSLSENRIYCSVQDEGPGFAPSVLGDPFNRYRREPGIEDGRCGIGFGMAIVKAVANAHDGTVLIDHPESGGARVTISLALSTAADGVLRSPVKVPTSERVDDRALMELSDILPLKSFKK